MTKTILITGANRGIGLEFTRQCLSSGASVIATCRDPNAASELTSLVDAGDKLQVFQLDVTERDSIHHFASDMASHPIDTLINNAGVFGVRGESIENVTCDTLQRVMLTNAFGPLELIQAMLPGLKLGHDKLLVSITSRMGSIGDNDSGGRYSYRASKAASNMLMKSLAIDLADEGFHVLSLHPGWVRTDMGGEQAPVLPQESVSNMRAIMDDFANYESGGFYHSEGHKLPW